MSASVRKQGTVVILELEGKLGIGSAVDEFRAKWADALATGAKQIVVVLSRVSMVDSSGIGSLIRCHSAVTAVGGKMKLAGANDIVRHSFKTTRLDSVFELYDNEAGALSSFAAS